MTRALLDDDALAALRQALAGYTVDAVHDRLGLAGRAALGRGDLTGVARHARGDDALGVLIRLFLAGAPVPAVDAARALAPLDTTAAVSAGLLAATGPSEPGTVRAGLDLRPYSEDAADAPPWWVVADLGADARPGPLAADHVLGVGAASLALAGAVPRERVGRALDVGTGSGVQALHLSRHADAVVATDVSSRALACAATTLALSGVDARLRQGSLLEPVAGDDPFDLVVANPPFVVSDGRGGYDYRDSGLAGDRVCETLVRGLPDVLAPDGLAVLLANWIVPVGGDWRERVGGWLAGSGCDAWVWQRELADPAEYVSLWLRDAGGSPADPDWSARYDAWLDWFEASGVAAVGMGVVTLRRPGAGVSDDEAVRVLEDVPQALEPPAGAHLRGWFGRARWLADRSDADLLAARLRAADGLVLDAGSLRGPDGWAVARRVLRQSHGMRWEIEADEAVAALVAGADGDAPLGLTVQVLALTLGRSADEVAAAALPAVRDLVARGLLEPADGARP